MATSGSGALAAFCEQLAGEPRLAGSWCEETDPEVFAARMAAAGSAAGYEFSPEEVIALLEARRRAWRERILD